MIILVAPLESDSQLVKLFHEYEIECAFSCDYGLAHFSLPLVLSVEMNGECRLVDVDSFDLDDLDNEVLKVWI